MLKPPHETGKKKHLTLNERIDIAEYLARGISFKDTATAFTN